jgi:uncharacterized protein YidB (DUF937 family)
MIDQLINLVKEHAGNAIIKNPVIPNEKNDNVIKEASNSIAGSLKNMISGGQIGDVLKMFGGKQDVANNPVTNKISGNVINDLQEKFGLDRQAAKGVADQLVPDVMSDLVRKTNDSNDKSFDIQGIFNNLSGGSSSGFNVQGLLDKVKGVGFDKDGDGDTDLNDLMKMVTDFGGKNTGGILDKVKNVFN